MARLGSGSSVVFLRYISGRTSLGTHLWSHMSGPLQHSCLPLHLVVPPVCNLIVLLFKWKR